MHNGLRYVLINNTSKSNNLAGLVKPEIQGTGPGKQDQAYAHAVFN